MIICILQIVNGPIQCLMLQPKLWGPLPEDGGNLAIMSRINRDDADEH